MDPLHIENLIKSGTALADRLEALVNRFDGAVLTITLKLAPKPQE